MGTRCLVPSFSLTLLQNGDLPSLVPSTLKERGIQSMFPFECEVTKSVFSSEYEEKKYTKVARVSTFLELRGFHQYLGNENDMIRLPLYRRK